MNISNVLSYVVARAKEPSTAASVAAILAIVGVSVDPGTLQNILVGFAALAGLFGVVTPESK